MARRPAPSLQRIVPSMSKRTSFTTSRSGSSDDEAGHDAAGAESLPNRRNLSQRDPRHRERHERLQVTEHRNARRADAADSVIPDKIADDERAEAAIDDGAPHGHRDEMPVGRHNGRQTDGRDEHRAAQQAVCSYVDAGQALSVRLDQDREERPAERPCDDEGAPENGVIAGRMNDRAKHDARDPNELK